MRVTCVWDRDLGKMERDYEGLNGRTFGLRVLVLSRVANVRNARIFIGKNRVCMEKGLW